MSCGRPEWAPLFFVMNIASLERKIHDLALPLAAAQGLEIWGLEVVDGPRLVVRLYVDTPQPKDRESSASIGQCEEISRQLELAMDVEENIDRSWMLEVSSPGLERRFFRLEQMRPYIGDLVEARLCAPLEDGGDGARKNWRGELLEIGEDSFTLQPCTISEDGEVTPENLPSCRIPWQNVRRARRLHVFRAPRKPGGKRKKA